MIEDMVLKKRRDYGFNGFHVPFIPRAPRSARRPLHNTRLEDSQICAFDLLASLAGKLLQETESSSDSSNALETNDLQTIGDNIVKMEIDENNLLKKECLDQGSCDESVFAPAIPSSHSNQKCIPKKKLQGESYSNLEHSSEITNSDSSEKVCSDEKSAVSKTTSGGGLHCKVEGGSPVCMDPGELATKDSVDLCKKFPALVNPLTNDSVPNAGKIRLRNDSKLGSRDDDENLTRFNKPGTKPMGFRHPSRTGERRLRKLLTYKYWKVAPKLKDCDLSKPGYLEGGVKPFYRKRKICYGRERYHYENLYKRRRFSDNSLVVTSDGGFSSESVCNSPQKGMNIYKNSSENGASYLAGGHQSSINSKDSHVKLSIKSFRIPELFIEVPESATIGSLKRTVMETVTAILGGGLRVGMLLHGKKVRDDNRTLSQAGITSQENLDTLGFTLEPSTTLQAPPVDPPIPLSCDTSQLALRPAPAPVLSSGISEALPYPPPLTISVNSPNNKNELLPFSTDKMTDKTLADSRDLVAIPSGSVDSLAVVPVNQKARRSEIVQRRTRRPFSVTEVEALVEAVEELGTGRWRDVKLRSFENADHRTYVDLKDKWKTLVHTAKIAPQQRRGEPVPQELLDRVLAAHAYWSKHQAKQQGKNQAAVAKIAEAGGCGRNIVD